MKIRDIQNFRFFYKTGVRKTRDKNRDENFIGSSVSSNGKTQFGFFDIYHGDKAEKEGIEGFLRGFLDMAQDSQAIFEFLQNAVDSNSTTFEMYYDEKYFLAFNNGSQFNFEGIRSILNVGVSTKSQDSSNIGKFGIGFKLIHRLVGEKSGLEELKRLSGPILFSWGSSEQFKELQNFSQDGNIEFEQDNYFHIKNSNGKFGNAKNLPWLFKILLTNFPCQPEETIRNLNYREVQNTFTKDEVVEVARWAKNKIKVDTTKHSLNSGSLFFLRLGKNKGSKLSNKRTEEGIQFSLSILNNIAKHQGKLGISQIHVNENVFESKKLFFERFVIKFGSEEYNQIKPQRRNEEDTSDIEVLVGFMDYKTAHKEIKGNPNFYLFFPLSEEVHNLSFIIHSTGFYNASQRTNLQGNENSNTKSQGINESLLRVIAEKIKQKLLVYLKDTAKNEKFRNRFLNIYSNLLLSDKATENHKNWVDTCFIEPIFDILKLQVPTQNGYFDNPENVKIKSTFLPIHPYDFGCPEIEWFAWQNEIFDKALIDEAQNSEKLKLEKWDIVNLLKYAINKGQLKLVNEWVKQANERHFADAKNKDYTYLSFIQEIDKNLLEKDLAVISQIKLLKFSDGNYYSLNEVFANHNAILIYDKVAKIKLQLRFIGLIVSNLDISKNQNLLRLILPKINEENLFKAISEKCKENKLRAEQKINLFFTIAEFDRVGPEKLKDLELFKDTQGNNRPLRTLLKADLQVPNWLFCFKIHIDEYIPELDKFLLQESEIYKAVILVSWEVITKSITELKPFYEQVVSYFNLDDKNASLSNQKFIYLNNVEGFVSANEVFYNSKFSQITRYKYFQDAVLRLTDVKTPHKEILSFLTKAPFKIDNTDLFDNGINDNTELNLEEIKSILAFCKINNEHFFEKCFIEKQQNTFLVSSKSDDVYQIRPSKEVRLFISANLADTFKVLPFELDEHYKDEVGIIQGEKLYDLILDYVNEIDDYKEQLVDIIHYDEPKRKFLLQLSEVRLVSEKRYIKDDFEFKVLERACNINVLRGENDIQTFRDKIVIETEGEDISICTIQAKDEVVIENQKFSLAKILPDTYQNSDHLSRLISQFVVNGINKEQIENLFGIKREVEPSEIFNLFSEQTVILQNAEQLAFLLMFAKVFDENIENFKVKTLDAKEWELKYDYYLKSFSFIGEDYLLEGEYSDICKIFELPVLIGNSEHQILLQPYFSENKFICPNIKSTLTEDEKTDFLDFIFNEYKKNRTPFTKDVDWSKINEIETKNLLGFNSNHSVFPNQYASESEVLPDYLIKWIGNEKNKIDFLTDLGIWTENSVIVELRKYLSGEIKDFQSNRLAQEIRFNEDETTLFNSLEWLKEKEIELKTADKFETFKKVVDVINENRTNKRSLEKQEEFDFEELEENSTEWKKTDNYKLFLYRGTMPKIVKLVEIEDYVFYRYNDNDYFVNDDRIFINKNLDINKTLQKVASDESNDFSFEELWKLYNKEEPPEARPKTIKDILLDASEEEIAYINDIINVSRDKDGQIDANTTAKIKTLKYLKANGDVSNITDKDRYLQVDSNKIIVRSAQKGLLYLDLYDWGELNEVNVKIAIYTNNEITIFDSQEALFKFCKPQNTFGVLRMPNDYNLDDYNNLDDIKEKSNWHFVFIVNKDAKAAKSYEELLNLEDYKY